MSRAFSPRVDVIRTVAELRALEPVWSSLSERFATPILDHDWFLAAAETLYEDGDLRIVVVREDGVVTGIAPLVISPKFDGRLSVIGADEIFEPGGWLYASDRALDALLRGVLELGRVSVLQRLPAALADGLAGRAHGRGLALVRPARPTLAVPASGAWDEFMARLSASARHEQKHMRRRLADVKDKVALTRARPAAGEVPALLDAFLRVEAAGWKGRKRSALAFRHRHRAFYLTYMRAAARRGRALISSLSVDGDTMAMELAVEAYGRVWSLKSGYDERFAKLGPGLLLVAAGIRAVFNEGLAGYEFLGAAEPWQERWVPVAHQYRAVTIYPFSFAGLAGLGSDAVHYLGRRVPFRQSA